MTHDISMQALDLVARIRAAAGDPEGRLMQDEFINRVVAMREMEKVLRQVAGGTRKTREQQIANACVTFFDALENKT
jgi:hypothetical protein